MYERRRNPIKIMANPQSDHPSCRTGVDGVEVKRLKKKKNEEWKADLRKCKDHSNHDKMHEKP
jgi:hypothetical protein